MLKELLYTGMGAAALIKEKVEAELDDLQKKGKINTDDAKSFIASIEAKGKEEDERLKEKSKEMLKEIIDELGLATKEDIEALKKTLKEG